jgi:hypothetical protein
MRRPIAHRVARPATSPSHLLDKDADHDSFDGEGPRPLAQILDRIDANGARRPQPLLETAALGRAKPAKFVLDVGGRQFHNFGSRTRKCVVPRK